MADRLILVNGLPGSGKTSLSQELARHLPAALIAKDAIKEAVARVVDPAAWPALGSAAAELAWSLVATIPGTVLLESWWFAPRDLAHATAGVRRCGQPATIEVWCEVAPELARQRYEVRQRHPIYNDSQRLADSWPRWAREAQPLGVWPTIRVATDRPLDIVEVSRRVVAAFDA